MIDSTTQYTPSTIKRFWSKVNRAGPDECWEWTAGTIAAGYGQLRMGSKKDGTRRMVRAHRISWEIHNGPIPDGLHICHTCDNRPCCNPQHLWLGTHQDNTADRNEKGRQARGVKLPRTKLTPENVRHIRTLIKIGASRKGIAARFGVTPSHIGRIVRDEFWKHVP